LIYFIETLGLGQINLVWDKNLVSKCFFVKLENALIVYIESLSFASCPMMCCSGDCNPESGGLFHQFNAVLDIVIVRY